MTLVPRILDGLKENGADDVIVVVVCRWAGLLSPGH
jgi:methylmalonyl-CoA mutase cobalamin-binding subunit